MSSIDTFVDAGAQVVAGQVVLDGESMGKLRDGDLHLSDAGRAKLNELQGEDKPAKPAAKKTAKKAKADEPVEPPVEDVDDLLDGLDV